MIKTLDEAKPTPAKPDNEISVDAESKFVDKKVAGTGKDFGFNLRD